jgi:large conductance mechanosensitive channel
MGMLKEFKEFAMKGNVVDLAVGLVIGAAFTKIVNSLVTKIFMPTVGALTGKLGDLSKLAYKIEVPGLDPILIGYGEFISAVIEFIIVAFCLFLVIKAMNTLKRKQEHAPPAEQPADVKLLTEIRDLLKARTSS